MESNIKLADNETGNQKLETKDKILFSAAALFAKNGFDGTSMRKIASSAKVSLASINYHFKSKQDLYAKILINAHQTMDGYIKDKIEESDDFLMTTQKLYSLFLSNADMIRNTHSMMTNANAFEPSSLAELQKVFVAPPGFTVLLPKLNRCLNDSTPPDVKFWVINNTILYIFNWIIWTNKDSLSGHIHTNFNIGESEVSKMIRLHCEALISYVNELKEYPKICQYDENFVKMFMSA
jgi:AcrR family transcriptional regulator